MTIFRVLFLITHRPFNLKLQFWRNLSQKIFSVKSEADSQDSSPTRQRRQNSDQSLTMPSTSTATSQVNAEVTPSGSRRVTFKEEVDGEEHNEEDAIQVSLYTFNLLWALVEGGTRQMLDRLIIPSVLAIVICVSSLLWMNNKYWTEKCSYCFKTLPCNELW